MFYTVFYPTLIFFKFYSILPHLTLLIYFTLFYLILFKFYCSWYSLFLDIVNWLINRIIINITIEKTTDGPDMAAKDIKALLSHQNEICMSYAWINVNSEIKILSIIKFKYKKRSGLRGYSLVTDLCQLYVSCAYFIHIQKCWNESHSSCVAWVHNSTPSIRTDAKEVTFALVSRFLWFSFIPGAQLSFLHSTVGIY